MLFIVTVVVCTAYCFQDTLPDNYLVITSSSDFFSYISYYLTSFVVLMEYYSGPWVFLPFFIFAISYAFLFSRRTYKLDLISVICLCGASFCAFYLYYPGFLGNGIYIGFKNNFSDFMAWLIIYVCALSYLILCFRKSFFSFIYQSLRNIFNISILVRKLLEERQIPKILNKITTKKEKYKLGFKVKLISLLRGNESHIEENDVSDEESVTSFSEKNEATKEPFIEAVSKSKIVKKQKKAEIKKQAGQVGRNNNQYYQIVKTLEKSQVSNRNQGPDDKYFEDIIIRIEDKLKDFNIDGHIINILKGPVVDTFELELGNGVRVSKVTGSAEDLSMALYGAPIRIVYPMRGKTTVGIEVPRNPREIIYLDEILGSKEFNDVKYSLPLAMGKDAFGQPFIVDLVSMPHMLVAGATGSGKSVFINTILVSLLMKKSPDQMKLILIDPKQLELSLYSHLPHLLLPVVTEAKMASLSLAWVVREMERRYSILKEFKVRNLSGFNEKLKYATPEMLTRIHPYYENQSNNDGYNLPFLVVIVDEFADLILTRAGKEIENNICRLAGKARAAGIHLIIATQRPSVDVITGLIKSNFPTRVSFRVTTSIDSRTILSAMGAEKLLGKGDMLYKDGVETIRVHSSYVDEDEIEILTNKLSEFKHEFCNEVIDFIENGGEDTEDHYSFGSHISTTKGDDGMDSLFNSAVDIVVEYRTASASMLQRRLKIGYNRAANLIEMMEAKGVVGPAQGSKPRKVLIGHEQQV